MISPGGLMSRLGEIDEWWVGLLCFVFCDGGWICVLALGFAVVDKLQYADSRGGCMDWRYGIGRR